MTMNSLNKLTQKERLRQEYAEYKRYSIYGDNCDSDYYNQCVDFGTQDCNCEIQNKNMMKLVNRRGVYYK